MLLRYQQHAIHVYYVGNLLLPVAMHGLTESEDFRSMCLIQVKDSLARLIHGTTEKR
jgi:hypothetical protein